MKPSPEPLSVFHDSCTDVSDDHKMQLTGVERFHRHIIESARKAGGLQGALMALAETPLDARRLIIEDAMCQYQEMCRTSGTSDLEEDQWTKVETQMIITIGKVQRMWPLAGKVFEDPVTRPGFGGVVNYLNSCETWMVTR